MRKFVWEQVSEKQYSPVAFAAEALRATTFENCLCKQILFYHLGTNLVSGLNTGAGPLLVKSV